MPEVITVQSDSGMMGGSVSHEYMLLTPVGEDSIVICDECGYRSNMEAAENQVINNAGTAEELECIETPDCKTIEDVCAFLESDVETSCKAVVYQKNSDDKFVVAFVRGDYEVNETKLRNIVGEEIHTAVITDEDCLTAGYIGPYNFPEEAEFYLDVSLKGIASLVAGANKEGYHYKGLNLERDLESASYVDIAKVKEGGICPCCQKPSLAIKRGIEVGNIFQLGTKYTKSMDMQYTDENGKNNYPVMGCYGIGVGRLAASICEAHHDEYGPVWPISIAPWEVQLCCLRADDEETKKTADSLYNSLQNDGIEVIYDDRSVRPGEMFSDADLIGAPIRVIASPRNLKESAVEITTRDKSVKELVPVEKAAEFIKDLRLKLFAEIDSHVENYK